MLAWTEAAEAGGGVELKLAAVAEFEARRDGASSTAGASGGATNAKAASALAIAAATASAALELPSLSSIAAPSSVESVCILAWIAAALSKDAPPGLRPPFWPNPCLGEPASEPAPPTAARMAASIAAATSSLVIADGRKLVARGK
jgi:hypothetical protein